MKGAILHLMLTHLLERRFRLKSYSVHMRPQWWQEEWQCWSRVISGIACLVFMRVISYLYGLSSSVLLVSSNVTWMQLNLEQKKWKKATSPQSPSYSFPCLVPNWSFKERCLCPHYTLDILPGTLQVLQYVNSNKSHSPEPWSHITQSSMNVLLTLNG